MTRNRSLIDQPDSREPEQVHTSDRIDTGQVANSQLGGWQQLTDLQSDRYSDSAPQSQRRRLHHGLTAAPANLIAKPTAAIITNEPPVLRRPAPYNLTSLRDLYTQIPDSSDKLKRFGSEVFVRRDRAVATSAPLDMPIGPDYVLGPGDSLTINLWGGVSQTLSRVVSPMDTSVSRKQATFRSLDSRSKRHKG